MNIEKIIGWSIIAVLVIAFITIGVVVEGWIFALDVIIVSTLIGLFVLAVNLIMD